MFTATAFSSEDVVRDGLVLWLDANDKTSYPGTGTVWRDLSLESVDGTLVNGPTFNSDNGGSVVFDGINDKATTLSNYVFGTGSFTISAWFKPNGSQINNASILSLASAQSTANWQLSFRYDNLGFFLDITTLISSTYKANDTWTNVNFVRESTSSNGFKIYINGVLNTTATVTNDLSDLVGYNLAVNRGNNAFFNGNISNTLIYNRALSAQEVVQNFNAIKPRFGIITDSASITLKTDLLYWWDLDTGGSSITDQHSGLVLSRQGTGGTTSIGTAPDGGNCIQFATNTGGNVTRFVNSTVYMAPGYDTAFTINIWARDTGTSSTGNWRINHRNGNPTFIGYWQINRNTAAGNNNCSFWPDGITNPTTTAAASAAALNTWRMYTLVRRGNEIEQWNDGVLVASASFSTGTMDVQAAPYAIGGAAWVSNNSALAHRGQLWCAGHWYRALSASEILALYNGGTGLKYAAL